MKKIVLTTALTLVGGFCLAQNLRNTLYLEAGGTGLWGSFNYERQLTSIPRIALRAGVGIYTEDTFYLTLPVGLSFLHPLRNPDAFIEGGLGASWTQANARLFSADARSRHNSYLNFVPSLGYRRHMARGGMWRVSLTPVINRYTFMPWVGVAFGKRF